MPTVAAPPVKVILVEDSPEEREAFQQIVRATEGLDCVGAFSTGEEAIAAIPALSPDVVLMDIGLPGMSGIDCIRTIKAERPAIHIMMLTVFENHDGIFQSLKAGASGYLLKKEAPRKLAESIRELMEGGAPMSAPIARQVVDSFHTDAAVSSQLESLSAREAEVLELLSKGLLYKEIADRLGLQFGSVRTYVRRIYEKLHVRSRTEATRKRLENRK